MKRLLIILLLLAALSGVAFASPDQTDQCLLRLTPYVDIVNDAGLYPSVMLAQEILETAHCRSEAVNYNNFWGIKCMGGLCLANRRGRFTKSADGTGRYRFRFSIAPGTRRKPTAGKFSGNRNIKISIIPAEIHLLTGWRQYGRLTRGMPARSRILLIGMI